MSKDITDITDKDAIKRVLAGEALAFEAVIRRHNQRLFRVVLSILRNEADALDAVQDTYVSAFNKLAQFRGPDGFAAWLNQIARNEALMRIRKSRRWTPLEAEHQESPSANHPGILSPERELARKELSRVLQREIDGLPDHFREVFVLRGIAELSTKETASLLNIPEPTVKTKFFRAKEQLRIALDACAAQSVEETLADGLTAVYHFAGERCDAVVAGVLARIQTKSESQHIPSPSTPK